MAGSETHYTLPLPSFDKPVKLLIVDSFQTVQLQSVGTAAGAVTQLKECTAQLVRFAKGEGVSVLIVGLGRVVQDLLLWCTMEFGYLRLSDGFVQGSSIMPQKRNPVALEHARAIGSKALGQTGAILLTVHNTPFGDIVDTEDDLQPLVFAMFDDALRTVKLVAAAMEHAKFDRERLAERAGQGWITVTELADTLARDHGVAFRQSHTIASRLVSEAARHPGTPLHEILAQVSQATLGRPIALEPAALAHILSPRNFVEVRTTPGGPAPQETGRAIERSRELLASDGAWVKETAGRLRAAEHALRVAVARLGEPAASR